MLRIARLLRRTTKSSPRSWTPMLSLHGFRLTG